MISKIRNFITRKVGSKVLTNWVSEEYLLNNREEREKNRISENRGHEVYYFHQLKDPYSYLACQTLSELLDIYNINLKILVVGEPNIIHEPDMFYEYCFDDASSIANNYGLNTLPSKPPSSSAIKLGERILLNEENLGHDLLIRITEKVWSNEIEELEELSKHTQEVESHLEENNLKRKTLGHYQGGVFHYEGENYWGVDRLSYLEDRLEALGLKKNDNTINKGPKIIERPSPFEHEEELILEFFPSLNSPYTYISFERVKQIESDYPVRVITKPVLPMLMRNMEIPSYKGKYILTDTAREARRLGIKIGPILSPLGKPAERAYSLFPWVNSHGKGLDYMYELMKSSFADGVDIGEKKYLKNLIKSLDLNWKEASKELDSNNWKQILEQNRLDMYEGNSWGVPSFKLMDEQKSEVQTIWGQDRIWQIEKYIKERLRR